MARIFDNDANNYLAASAGLGGTRTNYTIGAWIKGTADSSTQIALSLDEGSGTPKLRVYDDGVTNICVFDPEASPTASGFDLYVDGVWQLVVGVMTTGTNCELFFPDGTTAGTNSGTYPGLTAANLSEICVGKFSGSPLDPFNGKIAHVFGFTRALSSGEVASLYTANPGTLSSTSRWFYYPLITSSLTNEWTPGGGDSAGTLAVNGTVANDSDDPYGGGGGPVPIARRIFVMP
jgi:hypothetical protein